MKYAVVLGSSLSDLREKGRVLPAAVVVHLHQQSVTATEISIANLINPSQVNLWMGDQS